MTFGTGNLAGGSIPISPFSTGQTHIFRGKEGLGGTDIHALSLIGDRIARAVLALGAHKEYVLEGKVLGEGFQGA